MIQDNLLDYQYELKPLADDFHTTKDSNIFVNDANVRIDFLLICMTLFLSLICIKTDTFHSLYCVVLFWSQCVFLLDNDTSFSFLLVVVVIVGTNTLIALVFLASLGVDAYHTLRCRKTVWVGRSRSTGVEQQDESSCFFCVQELSSSTMILSTQLLFLAIFFSLFHINT